MLGNQLGSILLIHFFRHPAQEPRIQVVGKYIRKIDMAKDPDEDLDMQSLLGKTPSLLDGSWHAYLFKLNMKNCSLQKSIRSYVSYIDEENP